MQHGMDSIARHYTLPVLQSLAPRLQVWFDDILPWRSRPPDPQTLSPESFGWLLASARIRRGHVPRRVVHVCGSLAPGGAERQVANTLTDLAKARLESLHLVCTYLDGDAPERHRFFAPRIESAGVALHRLEITADPEQLFDGLPRRSRARLPWLPAELRLEAEAYYRIFRRLRPEVVHSWLDYCNIRAGLGAVLAGVPRILLSCRNLNPSRFALHQANMAPAYQALARRRNVVLVNNSNAGAADYAAWLDLPRERFEVVHNGLGLGPSDRRDPAAAAALRAEYGIPAAAPLVGSIFGFRPEKRPLLWLETAAEIRKMCPDAWFLLVGDGALRDQVCSRAEALGLTDRLTLTGIREDIGIVLSALDVLLLTSTAEGTPNVALEAQHFGTPVVATAGGGTAEAIEQGVTGWVLATSDPASIADRVRTVLGDPSIAAAVRSAGPAFVQRRFAMRHMVERTLDLYGYERGILEPAS